MNTLQKLLTVLGIATSVHAANAADIAAYPPRSAPPPVAWSWTGLYLGGNVGAGWGTSEMTANVGPLLTAVIGAPSMFNLPLASPTLNGFLGGFQGGYNFQQGPIVYGLEGDFDFAGLDGTAPCVVAFSCNVKHDWLADFAGRLGIVAFDRTLLYLKGGLAWTDEKTSFSNSATIGRATFSGSAGSNQTLTGALLGAGAEYSVTQNWSAKLEYSFLDFGKTTTNEALNITPMPRAVLPTVPVTTNDFVHMIKGGINYHF